MQFILSPRSDDLTLFLLFSEPSYERYDDEYEKYGDDKYDHDYKHDGYGDYKTHVTYAKSYKHEPEYKEYE